MDPKRQLSPMDQDVNAEEFYRIRDRGFTPELSPDGKLDHAHVVAGNRYMYYCHLMGRCAHADRCNANMEPCLSCCHHHKASHFIENKRDPWTPEVQARHEALWGKILAHDETE